MKERKTRRGPRLFAAILASTLVLAASFVDASAQAVLNPNQVKGVVEFTNDNPEILWILDTAGAGAGFSYGFIQAESIGLSPVLRHSTFPTAETATRMPYELTVESSDAGIPYRVTVDLRLDSRGDRYLFDAVESGPLFPEPSPDETLDLRQCAGMLDVRFVDGAGNPLAAEGGSITAWRETASGTGQFALQAQDFFLPRGAEREYLAVNGDGSLYRVDVIYQAGTDAYSNLVRGLCREFVNVACDEVVEVVCPLSSSIELGEIVGAVDMLGEDEHRVDHVTRVWAFDGPLKNFRYDLVDGAPSSGPFRLENLMPSSAESPARGYAVFAEMAFRSGHRAEFFRTPWRYGPVNGKVLVEPGAATDLGDTFVIDPGYVTGSILLAGPPAAERGSCLQDLHRDADIDRNGDGVPDEIRLPSSHVGAAGIGMLAPGATLTAQGGEARAGFAGAFNAETDDFEGDFEMTIGGLAGESSIWEPGLLSLRFIDRAATAPAGAYQNSIYQIRNRGVGRQEIFPSSTLRVDHAYCVSEVQMTYRSLAGTLFNPRTRARGEFQGTDFQGSDASYYVALWYANGTPTLQADAAAEGLVTMCLPQGTYTLNPAVTAVNPGGGTSNTELPPVTLEVGCRQVISVSQELQVEIDTLPASTEESSVTLSGSVRSDGDVVEIAVRVNSSDPDIVCNGCGIDPEFDATVSLEAGNNEITVSAVDEFGNEASVSAFVHHEPPPTGPAPVLSGCEDIAVEVSSDLDGVHVDFDVSASEGCDGDAEVSCDHASGSLFGVGDTEVTCSTRDACDNEDVCSFTVSVSRQAVPDVCAQDDTAPVVACSVGQTALFPPNHQLVDVGFSASASDECDEDAGDALVTEVWSDEPDHFETGAGTGNHDPDVMLRGDTLMLRSERRGTEDGRVYLLISRAADASGNDGLACCAVVVPHDRSARSRRSAASQAEDALGHCSATGGEPPAGFTRLEIGNDPVPIVPPDTPVRPENSSDQVVRPEQPSDQVERPEAEEDAQDVSPPVRRRPGPRMRFRR